MLWFESENLKICNTVLRPGLGLGLLGDCWAAKKSASVDTTIQQWNSGIVNSITEVWSTEYMSRLQSGRTPKSSRYNIV